MADEIIPDVQLADNTSQRIPCVLVLDGSTSMSWHRRATAMNDGLTAFAAALADDPVARARVQVCTLRFGGDVAVVNDWTDAAAFTPPRIVGRGDTPLGAAMRTALDRVEARKTAYRDQGIPYTRPWLFLVSDGGPSDAWEETAAACRQAEAAGRIIVWPVGVAQAHMDVLGKFTTGPHGAVRLDAAHWTEMFLWLSRSLSAVSQSRPGDAVPLETPQWAAPA